MNFIKPDFQIPLTLIYVDKDIIVLNKQAGISVHPSVNELDGTLVNALIARYPEIKNIGENSIRPGIIHRLDKDTSGLLVVARNQKIFEFLKTEWQSGRVVKKYLTLVWGLPKPESGKIESELARSPKDFRKRIVVRPGKKVLSGKLAITEYKVIKKFRNFSLVEVFPRTGRTHQIRVHMASIGHSVVGDKVYGHTYRQTDKSKESPEGLRRQFLHAYYLSFSLPHGKKLALEADLPDDLEQLLTKLEK